MIAAGTAVAEFGAVVSSTAVTVKAPCTVDLDQQGDACRRSEWFWESRVLGVRQCWLQTAESVSRRCGGCADTVSDGL
ncbi:hypothetical protein ASG84_02410 [Rhodococcus sp. Leaf278]|nr:hypothetical protein ASG84_02410 [Rhodococcus sp. Leaf278]